MKTLLVYDSVFGNTERLALAMAKHLGPEENVQVCRVSDLKPEQLKGVKLLIVGSPTRAFRPTKAIVEFLKSLPKDSLAGIKVAAFDTRISTVDANSKVLNVLVKIFGYAAKPMANILEQKGGVLVMAPEGFFVKDSEGPLKAGELERAADWARQATAE